MPDYPFIGRIKELKSLQGLTEKKTSSLAVIRGRRRIGKSRLVEEFAKGCRFLHFSGLPPTEETTAQSQREEFSRQLAANVQAPRVIADDWSDLFRSLARETKTEKVIILFDEISWMGEKDPDFLGKLKNAWDLELKKNPQLILILCGSVSVWIEENILKSTGFMGRLSLVLDLKELSVPECNHLLTTIGFRGNAHEKFKILSVTGGIPRYLEEIKPSNPADENIKRMCFSSEGILFREFKEIFLDIFARRSDVYKKIIEILVEGDKEFSEIITSLGVAKTGHVSQHLSDLKICGFIRKDKTWNIKNGKASILSHYRLSDNYIRFYLKYINKNTDRIELDHFDDEPLSSMSNYDGIMGLQFENLVLNNRKFIFKKLNIYLRDIVSDNPYFQRPQLRKKGCQIDYLIQMKFNMLYACEIKFSRQEIKLDIIAEMKQKIANISLPRGFSVMPVLIHVNGVSDAVVDERYFSHIIDFSELLS